MKSQEESRRNPAVIKNLSRFIVQLGRLEKHPFVFGKAGPLTPGEIHTIEAIGPEGGVFMSEVAHRLAITKGAVTQMILRLEEKNLVRRTPNPADSRSTLVSLTAAGLEAYRAHEAMHLNFIRDLSSQLDEREIEIFDKCLEKLCRHLTTE
ncbi:MarR family transcriptional regulator [Paenibacillus oralis]|uniref:MarR family transcriptional regulator n=1 Tax=Paenibacillus oralis TaxID=2490856 RepID=A0A3P3TWE5_9BACL|nr:MarR family transcriptional regulator [Paenibacillus oralis]RRJ62084.1 MarR family transcriptional regulator [Paenibacillus oralis]